MPGSTADLQSHNYLLFVAFVVELDTADLQYCYCTLSFAIDVKLFLSLIWLIYNTFFVCSLLQLSTKV